MTDQELLAEIERRLLKYASKRAHVDTLVDRLDKKADRAQVERVVRAALDNGALRRVDGGVAVAQPAPVWGSPVARPGRKKKPAAVSPRQGSLLS